jgi:hypothetical protein
MAGVVNGNPDITCRPAGPEADYAPPIPLEWRFGQVFGERAAGEEVQEGKEGRVFELPLLAFWT